MAVPGLRFRFDKADKDPLTTQLIAGSWVHGFRGRNPNFEVAAMYTGTLIQDLMMTAERIVMLADQQRMTEELHEIFTMQIPVTDEQAYQGAA